jgi:hypothetical protein
MVESNRWWMDGELRDILEVFKRQSKRDCLIGYVGDACLCTYLAYGVSPGWLLSTGQASGEATIPGEIYVDISPGFKKLANKIKSGIGESFLFAEP